MTKEEERLEQARDRKAHWKRWGPYLSERAWGTVREDYSQDGSAWDYFPHDLARSKAYRWNEDGIAGICDRHQLICFAVAMWNGRDAILKERLFGLTGPQGNHAEDVKEYYFYLDNTPTHSYMKYLYKYPQSPFPYEELVKVNHSRDKKSPEYELIDTGIFNEDRYFDVFVEYAKADVEDILIRINVINRGPETATIDLLPTIWFRNVWSWGYHHLRPSLQLVESNEHGSVIRLDQDYYGKRWLYCQAAPDVLFTENESNMERLYNLPSPSPYVKDGINNYVVQGNKGAVNPAKFGTKAAAHYRLTIDPGETATVQLRFSDKEYSVAGAGPFGSDFDQIFAARQTEADEFYATVTPPGLTDDARSIMRQSFAGMLWSKQYYHYNVGKWLDGDPAFSPPPPERLSGRNHQWRHIFNSDILSMPDKWEYPWYAAWDLAFHCLPISLIDADFAKEQLILLLREWYMHPNGQLPAYEWAFGDVNPPVHAWSAWRVYKIEEKRRGQADYQFLERVFQKLTINFTWWVNRKDPEGMNVFEGGFLGLDNVGIFDRSKPLPTGGHLEQSDGTSWMAMYSLNLFTIAVELARKDPAYEDVASKFWEHFLYIASAMNTIGRSNVQLWNEEDGFFYDVLHLPNGSHFPIKIRSMVGLIPLFAVETLEPEDLERMPEFKRRMEWFLTHRPDLTGNTACMTTSGRKERRLMAAVDAVQLRRILKVMLDENEFLSPYGIRSVSRFHEQDPYFLSVNGSRYEVAYEPAESAGELFGGNSNWRGPIWFPPNYLIIESLQKFYHYYGDEYKVECPTGSGQMMNLWEVAAELSRRLARLFLRDDQGRRPVYGGAEKFQNDPHWKDLILFYEYFHGNNGAGLGASHQTGWTGLVAKLLQQSGE